MLKLKLSHSGSRVFCLGVALCFFTGGAFAEAIDLEGTLQKAMDNSYDLQIAKTDIRISHTDITAARADYFPNIQARGNLERLKDLQGLGQPVVVGNNLIPAGTRYQASVTLSGNVQLVDFGVRRRRLRIAKRDETAKTAAYDLTARDVKLKVIDLYINALLHYKSIKANQAILTLAQQAYQMKKRLNTAGTTSSVDVATEAIEVAQALDDIEEGQQQLDKDLQDLSFYTHEIYDPKTVELTDLENPDNVPAAFTLDLQNSADARYYDAQIEGKQAEIEMHRRQYLPQISAYSYYNLYGFDPDGLGETFTSLRQRTIQGGLSIALPVFDGLKNKAAIDRAKLEKEKLILQKTQALAKLQHQAETLTQDIETQTALFTTRARILNRTQDKLSMEMRLSDQQIIDKTVAIQDHIARIRRQSETEAALVQKAAAARKLRIMEGS